MIRLRTAGPTCGDCTTPYDAVMDRQYTVQEFVDEVCSEERNWGHVNISQDPNNMYGKLLVDYRHGVYGEVPEQFRDMIVKSAHGSGGWSRYDFTLMV